MSGIGDEIREFVRRSYADEHMDPRELLALADRADRETVPRPRTADGEPVVEGETLYDWEGNEWTVSDITVSFRVTAEGDDRRRPRPADAPLSHTCPDSWERIADELEKLSESNRINGNGEVFYRAGDLAERVRKLAKEGEHGAD
ncbi:hypothetical protein [Parafannyhessea umbonata]|uniref:Uncharacterized protein n=1 Tax=Parafannyhessea umbonata TaxID=604330 RepID=A0A6N7WTA1_9ACTN|nr:hypothetical protein [Parafannyhessea umbonata]MST60018.1 hypothetical protein [Parafannyhessea umbonata]